MLQCYRISKCGWSAGEAAGGRGGRGRGSRRGSRGAADALEPHGASPPPQAPFGDGGLMGDPQMRGRRPRGRGPHQPQPSPPGSATPNAPSREGSTPRDSGQSPREPPQMPVQVTLPLPEALMQIPLPKRVSQASLRACQVHNTLPNSWDLLLLVGVEGKP